MGAAHREAQAANDLRPEIRVLRRSQRTQEALRGPVGAHASQRESSGKRYGRPFVLEAYAQGRIRPTPLVGAQSECCASRDPAVPASEALEEPLGVTEILGLDEGHDLGRGAGIAICGLQGNDPGAGRLVHDRCLGFATGDQGEDDERDPRRGPGKETMAEGLMRPARRPAADARAFHSFRLLVDSALQEPVRFLRTPTL